MVRLHPGLSEVAQMPSWRSSPGEPGIGCVEAERADDHRRDEGLASLLPYMAMWLERFRLRIATPHHVGSIPAIASSQAHHREARH